MIEAIALALCAVTSVPDGDTIRCGRERVRLVGIDAAEMPGHCRRGRRCAPGDPVAQREALARFLRERRVTIERLGRDRYGRTIALVRAGGANQLRDAAGGGNLSSGMG